MGSEGLLGSAYNRGITIVSRGPFSSVAVSIILFGQKRGSANDSVSGTGGPVAQHAHPLVFVARPARAHLAGDTGNLRSTGPSARHGEDTRGTGGSRFRLHGSPGLSKHGRSHRSPPLSESGFYRGGEKD